MIRQRRIDPGEIFELLPEAVALVDAGGDLVAANAVARTLFGMSRALAPGGAPLASLGPLACRLAEALAALPGTAPGAATDLEDEASGCIREARVTDVRSADGELLLRIVRLHDVSSERRASARQEAQRAELRARVRQQADELHALARRLEDERAGIASQAQRLLAVEEAAGIGHWIWHAETSEMEFSPDAARLLDVPERVQPAAGGAVSAARIADGDRAAVQAYFARVWAGEPVQELRFGARLPGESVERRYLSMPPVYQHDGDRLRCAIGLVQDVTAHEAVAGRLARLNTTLESGVEARTRDLAEVARSLEGFAYMATHELRAPLRAINGGAAIALEEFHGTLDRESVAGLGEIAQLANRLDGLIDELRMLAAHAGVAPARAVVDLAPLARRCARELAARDVRLSCPEALPIEADAACAPVLWRQLLARLGEHVCGAPAPCAIDIDLDGGAVRIRLSRAPPPLQSDPLLAALLGRSGLRLVSGQGAGCAFLYLRSEPPGAAR